MDHDVWEDSLLETFERREEAKSSSNVRKIQFMNKADTRTVVVGLKRTLLALLTILMFAATILGFVVVASAHGYMAVLLFFASILGLIVSYILLYAQGIVSARIQESKGDNK